MFAPLANIHIYVEIHHVAAELINMCSQWHFDFNVLIIIIESKLTMSSHLNTNTKPCSIIKP